LPELTQRTQRLLDLLPDDATRARVLAIFADQGALYGPPVPAVLERVRFAVIRLALDGPAQLEAAENLYRTDARDLLMAAGFGEELVAHDKWCASVLPATDGPAGAGQEPADVVRGFIAAMNAWEIDAHAASRLARDSPQPDSYQGKIRAGVTAIFGCFCTDRERKQGRVLNPVFQKPPEYDPGSETVVSVTARNSSSIAVETKRDAILGGGRYRYLLRRGAGTWLIDNVQRFDGGTWRQHIL
jgi:hypothetical protein